MCLPQAVNCTLQESPTQDCFLVTHPLAEDAPKRVVFLIRCDKDLGVLGYNLPEVATGLRSPSNVYTADNNEYDIMEYSHVTKGVEVRFCAL